MRSWIGIVLILAALSQGARGQSFNNAGSAGAQFLKIGVGARAMGMGGAYGSAAGDATTLAWNPAGIGTMADLAVAAEHTRWAADLLHNFVGLAVPVGDQVRFGFHAVWLTSGDIEITTVDEPDGTGRSYDVSDLAVGLTAAVRLTEQLTVAGTVKYVEERIYDMTAGGVALDAGTWYSTGFRSLTLGFAVSNLGFDQTFSGRQLEVDYDPGTPGEPPADAELRAEPFALPRTFRASASFDAFAMFADPLPDHRLTVAVDFLQPSDTPERLAAGLEYAWNGLLFLRSGYLFNADELGWNAGGGVRLAVSGAVLAVDYAASGLGRFGVGHRFGISIGISD